MYSDDVWDEERWEAFLRDNDRRIDRLMGDIFEFMRDQPPPTVPNSDEMQEWTRAMRTYLSLRGWNDAAEIPPGDPSPDEEPELWVDITAEWAGEDDADEEAADVRGLPVYDSAYALARTVLEWANGLPGDVKDSALVQYCSESLSLAANVAKGHAMGFEMESIGGNIAFVKRGLNSANTALHCLSDMKEAVYMDPEIYRSLYESTYEVRNSIALYILDLRERLELGMD